MSNYLDSLNNIAEAIQEVEGSTKAMKVAEMPDRIKALGGSTKQVVLNYTEYIDTTDNQKPELESATGDHGAGHQYCIYMAELVSGTAKDFFAQVFTDPSKIYLNLGNGNIFENYRVVAIDDLRYIPLSEDMTDTWADYYRDNSTGIAIWIDSLGYRDTSYWGRRTYTCVIIPNIFDEDGSGSGSGDQDGDNQSGTIIPKPVISLN